MSSWKIQCTANQRPTSWSTCPTALFQLLRDFSGRASGRLTDTPHTSSSSSACAGPVLETRRTYSKNRSAVRPTPPAPPPPPRTTFPVPAETWTYTPTTFLSVRVAYTMTCSMANSVIGVKLGSRWTNGRAMSAVLDGDPFGARNTPRTVDVGCLAACSRGRASATPLRWSWSPCFGAVLSADIL